MKVRALVVGALAAVSAVSGFICLKAAQRSREVEKHGKPTTFRDLYEDNKSDDLGDLWTE